MSFYCHETTANNGSRYLNRRPEELPIPKTKNTYDVRIYHYALSKNIYGFNIFPYIFKN